MHGRVGATIVEVVLFLPGLNVIRTDLVVLAAAAVGGRVAAQIAMAGRPVAASAPLGVRHAHQLVRRRRRRRRPGVAAPPFFLCQFSFVQFTFRSRFF